MEARLRKREGKGRAEQRTVGREGRRRTQWRDMRRYKDRNKKK